MQTVCFSIGAFYWLHLMWLLIWLWISLIFLLTPVLYSFFQFGLHFLGLIVFNIPFLSSLLVYWQPITFVCFWGLSQVCSMHQQLAAVCVQRCSTTSHRLQELYSGMLILPAVVVMKVISICIRGPTMQCCCFYFR